MVKEEYWKDKEEKRQQTTSLYTNQTFPIIHCLFLYLIQPLNRLFTSQNIRTQNTHNQGLEYQMIPICISTISEIWF